VAPTRGLNTPEPLIVRVIPGHAPWTIAFQVSVTPSPMLITPGETEKEGTRSARHCAGGSLSGCGAAFTAPRPWPQVMPATTPKTTHAVFIGFVILVQESARHSLLRKQG
jgi:hypothetical protein